ncbi:MAG: tetratricopeptide repeat protein [Theionarchaea archaeon]|nr:tetratricopeptide repeat protein [Theionarchaea archaeon]
MNMQPKILCLFSAPLVNPDGNPLDALDVKAERDTIVRELSACNRKMSLRIGLATIDELARGVTDKFNILHLSGHGHQDFLVFEDEKGGSQPVTGDYLKKLIGTGGPFELAVVSACHSEKIAEMLVEAGVPHVIAIRCDTPVLDYAATTFIRQFYRTLFRGDSIQKAFDMAKILVEGDPHLVKIRPQLEFIAHKKGEPFVPEEEKFVLLPRDTPHSQPIFKEEIPDGVLSLEELRLSKTNLPARPQSFTGRSMEMHEVINDLLVNRFVTVTGTGGIGKTTVATEVARWFHSRGYFPDGIHYIDLRQVNTVGGVIDLFSTTLDLQVAEFQIIIEHLRECQCLLLLDNVEEVLWKDEDAMQGLVNSILKFAPYTKLLITSQRPVSGNLHEPERICRIFPLERDYAKDLFYYMAKRDFEKQEWESDAFRDLLGQLGGHPLSIVLMARQLTTGTTITDLIERIKTNKAKAIKVRGITDRDAEHGESLVASLASAYYNISESAKTLLGILSMLPAGAQDFTLKGILGPEAWEYVQELNDASLAEITYNRRVILLPPVRLYAMSVLTDEIKSEYGPKIMTLMGLYAQMFYEHLGAEDAKAHRFFFAMEEPNLRSAIELPCSSPKSDKECSVLGLLAPHLISLYIFHDRCKEAGEVGNTLPGILERLQDKLGVANTLISLGDLAVRTDDLTGAQEKYEKALEIYQQIDAKMGEANTLMSLGNLAVRTNDLTGAQEKYEKALEIYQQIDAKMGEANTLISLGDLAVRTDDLTGAQEKYEKALEIYQQIDDKMGEANTIRALGDLAVRTDDLTGAQEKYEKALEIYQQIDAKMGEANTLMRLGQWFTLENNLDEAETTLENAITIYKEIEDSEGQADVHMGKALISLKRHDVPRARTELDLCSSLRDKVLAHGEAAQWLIFYADHLNLHNFPEGVRICLEYAGKFASKAQDLNLQDEVSKRLKELS